MERVNINKSLTSKEIGQVPNAPSLAGSKVKTGVVPIPLLINFVKGKGNTFLGNRRVGIYKLSQRDNKHSKIITYKLGTTTYIIRSFHLIKMDKSSVSKEGYIIIKKGIFNKKKLMINELPKEVVDSINNNIKQFNIEYDNKVALGMLEKIDKEANKEKEFFEDLNL